MSWQPDTAFLDGLRFFSAAVSQLGPADWQQASPCGNWQAVDVLGHVGQATRFGTQLLIGESPAWAPVEPPGADVNGDPAAWWHTVADPARGAAQGVDLSRVVDSPMGRRPIGAGLSFPALDLFVHAWDIGRSAGHDIVIPAGAIEFAHGVLDVIPAESVRNERVFGAEVPAPPNATPTQSFIAWTGRDPLWAAPSS